VWRGRRARTTGDRTSFAYTVLLGILVLGAPLVRALWLLLAEPSVTLALQSPTAVCDAGRVWLTVWAVALLAGTRQGPAALPPFLVFALAESDRSRWSAFRRPLIAAVTTFAGISAAAATLVGADLAEQGALGARGVIELGSSGAAIGAITAFLWLMGQAYPRIGSLAATVSLLTVAISIVVPGASASGGTSNGIVLGVLVVMAVACGWCVPAVLERLDPEALARQALRWESAVAHAFSLDVTASAAAFRALPTFGRSLRAVVRSRQLTLIVPVSDVVGAVRTPGRLVVAMVLLGASGVTLSVAIDTSRSLSWFGLLAGALAYFGLGPLTEGVRHAAHIAADLPLYGISDRRLLALHSLFPLVTGSVLVAGVAFSVSLAGEQSLSALPLTAGAALGIIALAARVGDALRGPSPLFLLTPAPSALGDPMPAIRVLWALDGPILAMLAGLATAAAGASGIAIGAVAALVGSVCIVRWARRR
jgi:hypothetical protein